MSAYIPGTKSISNTSNGNVGINNSNPQYALDVTGNINLTGNLLNNGSTFSANTVSSGQSTQILFNQSGSSTGSYGLTFNSNTNTLTIGSSGSIFYNSTGINFNSNLIPTTNNLNLGSIDNPWKSIYISTGTVFLGPTGALQINSNGLISSLGGFAAPYFQVGTTNPGAGILLTQQNNLLYFQNELGVVGPVSVFNSSLSNPNNTYYSLTGNVGFGITGPQHKIDVLGDISASNTVIAQNFTGTNLHISSIESNGSTLNIGTTSTNTVNIGTSNSTQTVNIGTVGGGSTTINIGGVGDTVNVAGTLVYVNSTTTEISNPQFIINQSGTNINNTGLTVSQNGGPTGAYILVNPASNAWTLKAGAGPLVTLNQDVSTSASVNFNTVSATNFTGSSVSSNTVTTNKVIFDGVGSIYFQTGSSTGCYISGLNYNVTGASHYVYYNNTTKELTQSSPTYFFSYSTGTQQILTGSNSSTAYFQPVTFNINNILYHTFEHSQGSSVFTGTFSSAVTLQFSYNLQMHSTTNPSNTAAAVLYLDDSPIAGSYRSCTISNSSGEFPLNNTFLVNIPQGSHWIQLKVAGTSNTIYVGGISNIAAPTNSYTSANLCCTRVL